MIKAPFGSIEFLRNSMDLQTGNSLYFLETRNSIS
jgi:hypothetical protein